MLSSNSAAVSYEAAWTLVSLSSAPTAVRAAAVTYANLLNSQNDNNVKMIVLERLEEIKTKHSKIVQELLMDILRALSSPNPDICKKVLDVALDVVTARNVSDVVTTLKREVQKMTQDDNSSEAKGIVYCKIVVHTLMDFIATDSGMQSKDKEAADMAAADAAAGPKMITKNIVLSDGAYATQM
eukprot:9429764-Ditylum_brightwellii.AAC.1